MIMAARWLSASELAGLPGLPGTPRRVTSRASSEGWTSRPRAGRGGGREYAVDDLPSETRDHLAKASAAGAAGAAAGRAAGAAHHLMTKSTAAIREAGLAATLQVGEKGIARADAKIAVVRAFRTFHAEACVSRLDARRAFTAAYNAGEIPIDPEVRAIVPRVAERTLMAWDLQLKRQGPARLAGQYGNRKGAGIIDRDPELKDFIVGMMVEHPHVSAKHVMRGLRARFQGQDLPAYRTVQRFMASWQKTNRQVFAAVSDPDQWKSGFRAAAGDASAGISRLNQRWEMDSTPSDVMLIGGRHTVVGAIDIYSRRLKLTVAPTSSSAAVAACLRRALLDWGVPEQLVTDNGKDYVSRQIVRVLAGLDISHIIAPPFSPERKPFIERAFGTFARDLQELCPGYIGHSVADRKAIESRRSFAERFMGTGGDPIEVAMTAEDFQIFCDKWTDAVYAHEPHRGLGGVSPFDRAAAWGGEVNRIGNERALDILLAAAPKGSTRSVTKTGIAVEGATYIAPELAEWIGQTVQVRHDPADFGFIYVFDLDGAFLCKAECPERTGIDRREIAARTRQRQVAIMKVGTAEVRAIARRVRADDIVEEILDERVARAASIDAAQHPAIEHQTADLHEAMRALDAERAVQAPRLDPEAEAAAQARFKALQSPKQRPDADARPGFDQPDWAMAVWLIEHPDEATPDEEDWLAEFLETTAGRRAVEAELKRRGYQTGRSATA